MKFAIITHAEHKIHEQQIVAYEPYVKEMNLWLKYVDKVRIVAPVSKVKRSEIDSSYQLKRQISNQVGNDEYVVQVSNQIQQDESERHPQFGDSKRHPQLDWGSQELENDGQIPNQVGNDAKETIQLAKIPSIDITSLENSFKAILKIPSILLEIYQAMQWADHIHLRCPGNIGLLGCFVQILFPKKPKTVKYAGNWDRTSKQPRSYRLQKWILSNTFLTRNCKVLVYGDWPNQSKNIVPFFTASYSEKEIEAVEIRSVLGFKKQIPNLFGNDESERNDEILNQFQFDKSERHSALDAESHELDNDKQIPNQAENDGILKFIYVGGLTPGKQPLLSVQVIHKLKKNGYNVQLDMYGDGVEKAKITDYILDNSLEGIIILHGNTSKEIVKKAYQQAHFLVFISKSEGWPKVVAEAMFWGCVPMTSNVSCVPEMLGNGSRGTIVTANLDEIVNAVENYVNNGSLYAHHAQNGMDWSTLYTLEKFEEEIKKLL
jgi:glycosyltransferase involved in cell wall biosynthesis